MVGPVSGDKYHVSPGEIVDFDSADAHALLEQNPDHWERAGVGGRKAQETAQVSESIEIEADDNGEIKG